MALRVGLIGPGFEGSMRLRTVFGQLGMELGFRRAGRFRHVLGNQYVRFAINNQLRTGTDKGNLTV